MKEAIITGVTGQDGSYLVELLLEKGYKVIGVRRRSSTEGCLERIVHLTGNPNFVLVEGEISDSGCVYDLVNCYQPDEIYNLAAQSHVASSFEQPEYTFSVNTIGPLNFLEAIRRFSPATRFYQASTSEMFGKNYSQKNGQKLQNEETGFMPQSPYAVAKVAAHELVRIYRQGYNLFACSGILFNHESERRGEMFVTRKITRWLGRFYVWLKQHAADPIKDLIFEQDDIVLANSCQKGDVVKQSNRFAKLRLGNLNAYRDWGHAFDYVQAMHDMLQQDQPDDYVISSGKTHSVREFLKQSFGFININDPEPFIVIDANFYRPAEVDWLFGDCSKAKRYLNWHANISFQQLVAGMVKSDINLAEQKHQQ